MTFSTTVVLPVTERMRTAHEMRSFTHSSVGSASDGSAAAAAASAEARNLIFGGKNPAQGVQVPARPDRRNYSVQHSAETARQAAAFGRKIIENKKTKRIIEKKSAPTNVGTRRVRGRRDAMGRGNAPARLGWAGKTAPKAQPPQPTLGSRNGVKPREEWGVVGWGWGHSPDPKSFAAPAYSPCRAAGVGTTRLRLHRTPLLCVLH